jgi:hypothetical protein
MEFNRELAIRAYSGTSFSPEKRAESEEREFHAAMTAVREELEKIGGDSATLETMLAEFREKYLHKTHRILAHRTGIMSTMITGPANFPVARMNKRNDAHHRITSEFIEWKKRAVEAMRKKLQATIPQEEQDAAELDWQKKRLDRYAAPPQHSYTSAYICGFIERAPRKFQAALLDHLEELNKKQARPIVTTRNKIWKLREKLAEPEPEKMTGEKILFNRDGVTVVQNFDAARIQIFFPGKPDREMITRLKKSGWRWSPSAAAWQRYNNINSISNALHILEG